MRLLIANWKHSRPEMKKFLRSLLEVNNVLERVDIEIRLFVVPSNNDLDKIPFARVNHNKYMVTDKTAYIGKYFLLNFLKFDILNQLTFLVISNKYS